MRKKSSLKFVTFLLTLLGFIAVLARKCHRHDCQCRWQFFFRPPGLRLRLTEKPLRTSVQQIVSFVMQTSMFSLCTYLQLGFNKKKKIIKYYNMTWTKEMKIISLVRPM